MEQKQLRRSTNTMIGGVAAGVAEYANLDPALVRLLFVLLTLAGGPGLIIYIVLWAVMAPPANG
jgi:phage shock protein PspC (stress-responsive transcriptional regulator)